MNKVFFALLILIVAVSTMGCNLTSKEPPRSDEPGIIGYVMNKESDSILVINPEAQDFSSSGGVSEYYDAIWFTNAPQDIEVGEKVKVWFDNVMDSYPAQSEVIHLEVIPSQTPNGANLTESEALKKALTSELSNMESLIVVKNINYANKSDSWDIKLKEIWGDEVYDVQIDDK